MTANLVLIIIFLIVTFITFFVFLFSSALLGPVSCVIIFKTSGQVRRKGTQIRENFSRVDKNPQSGDRIEQDAKEEHSKIRGSSIAANSWRTRCKRVAPAQLKLRVAKSKLASMAGHRHSRATLVHVNSPGPLLRLPCHAPLLCANSTLADETLPVRSAARSPRSISLRAPVTTAKLLAISRCVSGILLS